MELNIEEKCEEARYSSELSEAVNKLGGQTILRLEYESDYQGYVDIDVLLNDGRVFTYMYWYGSCSGCDEWEDRGLSYEEIVEEMLKECTIYNNLEQYEKWREKVKG